MNLPANKVFWTWFDGYARPKLGVRAETFAAMFRHLDSFERRVVIIETGTCAGEINAAGGDEWASNATGCSTIQFNKYIESRGDGSRALSVDVNLEIVRKARNLWPRVEIVCNDSIAQLTDWARWQFAKVDLLYLDAGYMDWNDPREAQRHHLDEYRAIQPALRGTSMVAIDDTMLLPSQDIGGRGAALARLFGYIGAKMVFLKYQAGFIDCAPKLGSYFVEQRATAETKPEPPPF